MIRPTTISFLLSALMLALSGSVCQGFSSTSVSRIRASSPLFYTVIDAPTKEDLDRKVGRRSGGGGFDDDLLGDAEENIEEAIRQQGPLEWLEDDLDEPRDMKDPFHILILDQTYLKEGITVPYVASNLEYVLQMPLSDATEHSQFCFDNGMSCVGVWPREECLTLGRQLQLREIVCRVVPYADGGHRAWQAGMNADAADSSRFLG